VEQGIRKPLTLKGEITPPADKSISHRSLILNSIAEGKAHISNFLPAADCLSTLSCLQALGVKIERTGSEVSITGAGKNGFAQPAGILNAGNSGAPVSTEVRIKLRLLSREGACTASITGFPWPARKLNQQFCWLPFRLRERPSSKDLPPHAITLSACSGLWEQR
jgi:5-enolpyruvylshikimate-3-phosphate synthase